MDPQRAVGVGDLDEILALGVVHLDPPVEAARELRRNEELELPVARATAQSAGHEQRLPVERRSGPVELGHRRRDRGAPGIAEGARDRERRRLDDDRRPRATRHERLERLALERKAQRVANRGRDVGDRLDGRWRRQHDRVVVGVDEGEPRAVRQRQAGQGIER